MGDKENGKAESGAEIVFVLRLRAGSDGWWGQIRKIDEQEPCYVRNTQQLLALLETYWLNARTSQPLDTRL